MQKWKVQYAKYKKTPAYKEFKAKQSYGKKPKDKNAPKRPMSAYFIFSNEVRERVQEELDSRDFGQVAKAIKALWDNLSENERAKYQSKAAKAKTAYEKVRAKYVKTPAYQKFQDALAAWKSAKKAVEKEFKAESKVTRRKK